VSEADAGYWLNALDAPSPAWRARLVALYGGVLEERLSLIRRAVLEHIRQFGHGRLAIERAPGRVNLRGMHVDTHGGYLNLMSHQREVVVAYRGRDDARSRWHNVNQDFAPLDFVPGVAAMDSVASSWDEFLSRKGPDNRPIHATGHWGSYVEGAAVRATWGCSGGDLRGVDAVVAGDIPHGAALSSSAALCVAAFAVYSRANALPLTPESWICAARDAEWYTGARTGTSDQAASILARPGEIAHVALLAEDFSLDTLQYVPFPSDYVLIVANSCTRRSLSGAQRLAYTRNRFSYSVAMQVLRVELERLHSASDALPPRNRLSLFVPEALGGAAMIYDALRAIPESCSLSEIKARYAVPDIDAAYERFFAGLPADERPESFDLRGPLAFALAESERARRFSSVLAAGDIAAAGQLMNIGHEGDRVLDAAGASYCRRLSDEVLDRYSKLGTPIHAIPGDYGASSPALDMLVDTACAAGTVGACLTGAGIAGCIIALCHCEVSDAVAAALRGVLSSAAYAARAGLTMSITEAQAAEAVCENVSIAGAGPLPVPI